MNKENFDKRGTWIDAEQALHMLNRMVQAQPEASAAEGPIAASSAAGAGLGPSGDLQARLMTDLQGMVVSVLKLDPQDVTPRTPLMNLGLDSIAATEIGAGFARDFGITVPPTVFFEFQDLDGFAGYLLGQHAPELAKKYATQGTAAIAAQAETDTAPAGIPVAISGTSVNAGDAGVVPADRRHGEHGSGSGLSPAKHDGELKLPQQRATAPAKLDLPESRRGIEDLWKDLTQPTKPHDAGGEAAAAGRPQNDTDPGVSLEVLEAAQVYVDQARLITVTRKDGGTIECAVLGTGSPVLLIGGLVMHFSVMWCLQLKQLAARHRLIMVHAPGCGGTTTYDRMTLASLSDDLAVVLDSLGVTQPVPVIGYSFGGVLAQAFCIANPLRVSALAVAVTSPISEPANNFAVLMQELKKSARFMVLNREWPMAALPAYQGIASAFDFRSDLSRLTVPALVIAGRDDCYMQPSYSKMIAHSLPNARYVEFPGAGHLVGFTHHEAFNRLLLEFLEEVAGTKSSFGGAPVDPSNRLEDAPAFLPASPAALGVLEDYVASGEQGHCAILSAASAQSAFLLNCFGNAGKDERSEFNCYFLTSAEEALDAALRLVRHAARNQRPDSDGSILIVESKGRWQRYFDPLSRGPKDALVPGIHFASSLSEAASLSDERGNGGFVAVAFVNDGGTPVADIDAWLATSQGHSLKILMDGFDPKQAIGQGVLSGLQLSPDLVVLGEGISGYVAPVGACLVNKRIRNPWQMTPSESYVRHVMTNFGVTLRIVADYLFDQIGPMLSRDEQRYLRRIPVDPQHIYEAHVQYGNAGYAKVARLHGFDAGFSEARNMSSRLTLDGRSSRPITDCFVNVGTAPRGLNPLDVIDRVARAHDAAHDYWQDLGVLVASQTGLANFLPASSNVTAVEAALTLGLLATPDRPKLLCFTGGLGFTLVTAASSLDTVFDIFRKPFLPIYEHTVFIDPSSVDARERLAAELESGRVGLVWFETIQVDANASRPLPKPLIDLINRHKKTGGYLVGVDETQTNLVTGRFLHSKGLVEKPDIVALGTALCDGLFPAGMVIATDAVMGAAERRNAVRVNELRTRSRNQLVAHVALNSLKDIFARDLLTAVKVSGARFKDALQQLADEFPLIKEVRGEGHLLTIEFNLDNRDPFLQRSFGYLLWGFMLRDPIHGVAVAVCPIHNNCLRFLPPLTMEPQDMNEIVANLRRALSAGVSAVVRDCSAFAASLGDARTAGFLNDLATPQSIPSPKVSHAMNIVAPSGALASTARPITTQQMNTKSDRPTVCIIGAGVGGISMAKALKQRGISFDCFDKRDRIGGIWAYDADKKHTSVWYGMNMNTPRGLYQFSDFPMPESYPDFPSHSQVWTYLESYADHFNIRQHFHLNTGVEKASRLADGTWRVTLSTGEVRPYDVVVVANGHHNEPNLPAYADPAQPNAVHSKYYRTRHEYRDKNVLVVGVGNSGSQIAVDVSHDAKMTYLSLRRGVYVLPHYAFGIRMDKVMWQLNSWWVKKALPYPLHGLMFTGLYNLLLAKRSQMGMPKPDHLMMSCLPTLSENFANRIGDGKLKIMPEVRKIEGNKVQFSDGSTLDVDAVIYATGFKTVFPFLDPAILNVEDNRIPLYLRIFVPEVNNLLFIGLFQAVTWGFLDMMERQSIIAADYLAGTYQLPSFDVQKAEIEADRKIIEKEFLATLRNNYEMHGPSYMHKLALELKRGGQRAKAAGFAKPVAARAGMAAVATAG